MCFLFFKEGRRVVVLLSKRCIFGAKIQLLFLLFSRGIDDFSCNFVWIFFLPSFCTLSTSILCHRIFPFFQLLNMALCGSRLALLHSAL